MIVILEGCDKSGKSTQANEIKKYLELTNHLPTHIIHSRYVKGITKQDAQDLSRRTFIDLFELMKDSKEKRNLILDRSYLDEAVYGPLYRDQLNDYIFDLEKKYIPEINEHLCVLLFRVDPKRLIEREDGDSFNITEEAKVKEMNLFQDVLDRSIISNKYTINANESIEKITESIVMILKNHIDRY